MSRNDEFKYAAGPVEPTVCKHCGKEISTGTVSRIRLPNGAVYLWPMNTHASRQAWTHRGLSDIVLRGEGSLKELGADPEWNHEAEPLDGRSHEDDYARHVMDVRMHNILNGADPKETENLARSNFHIAHSLKEGKGFGII